MLWGMGLMIMTSFLPALAGGRQSKTSGCWWSRNSFQGCAFQPESSKTPACWSLLCARAGFLPLLFLWGSWAFLLPGGTPPSGYLWIRRFGGYRLSTELAVERLEIKKRRWVGCEVRVSCRKQRAGEHACPWNTPGWDLQETSAAAVTAQK